VPITWVAVRERFREIIEGPAERFGLRREPGLTERDALEALPFCLAVAAGSYGEAWRLPLGHAARASVGVRLALLGDSRRGDGRRREFGGLALVVVSQRIRGSRRCRLPTHRGEPPGGAGRLLGQLPGLRARGFPLPRRLRVPLRPQRLSVGVRVRHLSAPPSLARSRPAGPLRASTGRRVRCVASRFVRRPRFADRGEGSKMARVSPVRTAARDSPSRKTPSGIYQNRGARPFVARQARRCDATLARRTQWDWWVTGIQPQRSRSTARV